MKNLYLYILTSIFILAGCGGGGGGGGDSAGPAPTSVILTIGLTSFSTDEDTTYRGVLNATANETVTLNYDITSSPANGALTLSSNGNIEYNPNTNFFGSDEFQYSVTAAGTNVTKSATVSISVNPVNDPPSITLTQLAADDSTDYPLFISDSGLLEVAINIDDLDNETSSLTIEASSSQGDIELNYDTVQSTSSAIIDLSQINLSGKVDILLTVSDEEYSVSDTLKLWYAKKLITEDENLVYTLKGNNSDPSRKINKALIVDSMTSNFILQAVRASFKELIRFIGANDLDIFIDKYFNILVIEYPIGSSSSLGVEIGCNETDEDIFCFEADFIQRVKGETAKYFNDVDDYSVITGVDGRGAASVNDKLSVQPLISDDETEINDLLYTLKHEFGHTFMDLNDEYTDDFNVLFECIDTTDLPELECGNVDSTPNTSTQNTPESIRWNHHFTDINNVPGYDEANSITGIGIYEGTYYGTEDTYRPSYESIMNGGVDNSDVTDYRLSRKIDKGVEWDAIGQEVFEIKSLINQGMHDINVNFDDNGNVIVTHGLNVSESDYSINWYIDGVLDDSLINNPSVTLTKKESGVSSVAYRISPLGNTKIVGTDDPAKIRDFYDGLLSSYPDFYYCRESYIDTEGYNQPYCKVTARVWTTSSSVFPVFEATIDEAMNYPDVTYLIELSGLGAQYAIRWENF
ncbi:Ig-like domain-containing protein [Gammaproteobacteria bacterium]|nr:Ig-like domain-containing protein [Gammaproteobacteria bacterium]